MRRLITLLAILLAFGLPAATLAQELPDGVVRGQVINGTEGGGSVAGIMITLITYVDDAVAETRTDQTDEEGKFQFENVDTEYEYLVSAQYMEVDYYYAVVFEPGEKTAYVEVWVCDTTSSDESIRVGLSHTIINVEEESLLVTEVFGLVNDGDRTYVGTDGVLVFTLPEGASDFAAPQELIADYQLLAANRVSYLVPFPPGERQLAFSYQLAKQGSNELAILLEVNYPTDIFELMVGGEGIEVTVTALAPAEPVFTATDERFIHFHGENISRGTVINIHLFNLSGSSNLLFVILWVIGAVTIIGVVAYLVKRRKSENTKE